MSNSTWTNCGFDVTFSQWKPSKTSFLSRSAINCVRLLTRLLPYIFEEPEWRGFFWSDIPVGHQNTTNGVRSRKQKRFMFLWICFSCSISGNDQQTAVGRQTFANFIGQWEQSKTQNFLLFAFSFQGSFVLSGFYGCFKKTKRTCEKEQWTNRYFTLFRSFLKENPEDIHTIDSCEYIWEAGVGFSQSPPHVPSHDVHRTEILKLLLTCFSETIYMTPSGRQRKIFSNFHSLNHQYFSIVHLIQVDLHAQPNKWLNYFTSAQNR